MALELESMLRYGEIKPELELVADEETDEGSDEEMARLEEARVGGGSAAGRVSRGVGAEGMRPPQP